MNYIASAYRCNESCESNKENGFKNHASDHSVLSQKEMSRKLNELGITYFGNIVNRFQQKITKQIDALVQNFKSLMIKQLEKVMCKGIFTLKKYHDEQLTANFRKASNLQFGGLTCHNMWEILKSFDSTIKSNQFQQRGQDALSQVRKKIQKIYQIIMEQDLVEEKKQKKQSKTQKKQPIKKQYAISESFKKGIELNKKKSEPKRQLEEDEISQIPLKQEQQYQSSKLNMDFQSQSEANFYKFQKSKKIQQKLEQESELSISLSSQASKSKLNSSKLSNHSTVPSGSYKTKGQPSEKSYIEKNEGLVYSKVSDLLDPEFIKNKERKFNIRVKVVQQIFFRIQQVEQSEKTAQYKKAKFVAGDETGIAVFYTNYIPEISKGQYLTLRDCILVDFNDSLQVNSTKCNKFSPSKPFNINQSVCISMIDNMKPMVYLMQHKDKGWPSIKGLTLLDKRTCKKINLIAKVTDILLEQDEYYECYIADGTGKVHAMIQKKQCPKLQQGKTYHFRRLHIETEKQGSDEIITIKSYEAKQKQKRLPPIEMNQMKYDEELIDSVEVIQMM